MYMLTIEHSGDMMNVRMHRSHNIIICMHIHMNVGEYAKIYKYTTRVYTIFP